MKMKNKIRETAEEILQEYTNCYSEADEDCLVKMLNRLASDVVREIFEELEERIAVHTYTSKSEDYDEGALDVLEWVDEKIDELKKKYESEEKG